MDKRPWVAIFSHTGKEIAEIARNTGRLPDVVLTDNLDMNTWDYRLQPTSSIPFRVHIPFDEKDDVFSTLRKPEYENAVITLHGFMKIIPKDLCDSREIWNGHPGLINYYSELRGKDPQEKTWENISSYQFIGSVVHRVTSIVDDASAIHTYCMVNNTCNCKEELYNTLRRTSLVSWLQFFDMKDDI